jgi:hypothetical protein
MCSFKGNRYHHLSTYRALSRSVFMTERGGEEGVFNASSDDIMGFGV